MASFSPALAPPGRLTRLALVLDAGDPAVLRLATLGDRAGIDAIWLRVSPRAGGASEEGGDPDVPDLPGLTRARLGLWVDGERTGPLPAAGDGPDVMAELGSSAFRGPGVERRGVIIGSLADVPAAIELADDIVLAAWRFPDLETAADEVRVRADSAGRDLATLGVAVLVPVSVGRTQAEARARIGADPAFSVHGDPADIGIAGTLEECQDRVIALAHAGITDLRCLLPQAPDVHDVIAQLTAITLGTTDVLKPGSLRSPAPPPPDGWGGRPPAPPSRWVSGGSRRG